MADRAKEQEVKQLPAQRWLVLTDRGVELQPTGSRAYVDFFAKAVEDYREQTTIVSETRYRQIYGKEGWPHAE